LSIQPAYKYRSLKAIKKAMAEVDKQIQLRGFGAKLSPFIIGVTGHGNVSRGVQEILNLLNPLEIHPKNMLDFFRHEKRIRHRIFKIIFFREEKFRSKDGKGFYFEDFLNKPKSFESNLDRYLPYLNVLIHGSYWDNRYPRLVTKEMIQRLTRRKPFRLNFIGDISCDINGSIELTYKATSHTDPTFTYDFKDKRFIDGYDSKGITILSIDNLPSELPRDASIEFSHTIREYVYAIAAHGAVDVADHIALPREIRNAVIMQNGKLTGRYGYLREHFTGDDL
jgi:alpha-aminoadipic semialdehyde synthase